MPLPLYPAMVGYVLANLRACDAAEVWPVVPGSMGPPEVAQALCQVSPIGCVFLHDHIPAAAIGANPAQPGVWGVWMFATDAWAHVWREVVRYARGPMERQLLARGAHRVQAHSLVGHPDAGNLLAYLGFQREGRARAFGGDRQDYDLWARLADDPAGIAHGARAA